MDMRDVKAVVTGGASGLGAATARGLAEAGAEVTILDRDPAGAEMAEALGADFAAADVTDEETVADALDFARDRMGGLNVAIACAGIAITEKTLGRDGPHREESFASVQAVNLTGSFTLARLTAARMEGGGAIVLAASIAAFEGQKGQVAYAASKGGVAAMVLPMARDLARSGIRVAAIAPGIFRTPMLEGLGQEVMDKLAADVVFPQRLGDPSEFAAAVRFVLECDYVNGTVLRLDGGLRMP